MNPSPEEALFALALEKPPEKCGVFLDVMCKGDTALRQRLEALLAAHGQPATELALPAAEAASTVQATAIMEQLDEAVGQTLGRYKLLDRVGEGGCGVVYIAEQTEPVRRRVALKVIKLGMDTKQVVAQFEAERQALEKDRQRRYDTANGLAADLKRHLNNEPVLARPPSTGYRLQKAFGRNKLAFAAATAIVPSGRNKACIHGCRRDRPNLEFDELRSGAGFPKPGKESAPQRFPGR